MTGEVSLVPQKMKLCVTASEKWRKERGRYLPKVTSILKKTCKIIHAKIGNLKLTALVNRPDYSRNFVDPKILFTDCNRNTNFQLR